MNLLSKAEQLTQIETAITQLQAGERVASVAHGDYAVKYERVELSDLIALRDRLCAEITVQNKAQYVLQGLDKNTEWEQSDHNRNQSKY